MNERVAKPTIADAEDKTAEDADRAAAVDGWSSQGIRELRAMLADHERRLAALEAKREPLDDAGDERD
jgi:hypothetical protein